MPKISPRQMLNIAKKIYEAIWAAYKSYKTVETYIKKWRVCDAGNGHNRVNFEIVYKDSKNENIDLIAILNNMDENCYLK